MSEVSILRRAQKVQAGIGVRVGPCLRRALFALCPFHLVANQASPLLLNQIDLLIIIRPPEVAVAVIERESPPLQTLHDPCLSHGGEVYYSK
jgi:hypothetical protein